MARDSRSITSDPATRFQIRLEQNPGIEQLRQYWLELEARVSPPLFLRWAWVLTWLLTYQPRPSTFLVYLDGELVAIGLFCRRHEWRHKLLTSDQMLLNQTGHHSEDQIWVEYNDFLAVPQHREQAVNACIQWILTHSRCAEEIIISMMRKERAEEIAGTGLRHHITATKPGYLVDLTRVRVDHQDFIQSLSKNTRYQVRRAIRLYEDLFGILKITRADSTEQALRFFRDAGDLHQKRWPDSGFTNEEFLRFHQNLITAEFERGTIELLHLTAGPYTIAYLYNLKVDKTIYFYLSGINYEQDRRLKPGYVAHCLAIQRYLDSGFETYDFMGGENRYKASLANSSSEFVSLRIWRPRLKFTLENLARKIKQSLFRPTR
jgi:hypothetical protein